MKLYLYLIFFISIIFYSCSGSYEPTLLGDQTEISLKSGTDMEGELLFVTDTSFFVASKTEEILEIGFRISNDMKIIGYSNRDWIYAVLLLEALPVTVFSIQASTFGASEAWLLMIIPVLNYFLYEMGTPPAPGINTGEVNKYTAEKLKKYSRFPQGLSSEQFKEFSKNKTIKKIF